MNKLLIVESPAKAKTIGKYLGPEFTVKASVGHVRDLPKKGGLAIAIDGPEGGPWTFTPTYEVSDDKKKVVGELRKAAKAADEIYLAPDPDREGEAIAWHLDEILRKDTRGKKVARVTYNEITKAAVTAAVAHPGEIDLKRVDAQQSRRILDRLVGFQVSPLLWKYLPYGRNLSAGRVQSVALRLLVEREREIRAFVPEAYWILGVEAKKPATGETFAARLARLDGKKPAIGDAALAEGICRELEGSALRVASLKTTAKSRHPYPPFTTSTLQQAASSVCGFTPGRTMSLAQKLYEHGLITYMRTDSVNIAPVARQAAADWIRATWGETFLPEKPNFYKSKAGAQEAHEAIRPTDVTRTPETAGLDGAEAKLYELVWRRFMASQMAEARLATQTATLEPTKAGLAHAYAFTASATSVTFPGFLKAMPTALVKKRETEEGEESDEVQRLPALAEGEGLDAVKWLSDRKETKPPPRYSEAALVKALEENGVGRPSTYAATVEVLVDRKYATREARQLTPTKCGEDVCDWLVKKLDPLFNVGYTAQMEESLDKVEEGVTDGNAMLSVFYHQFLGWLGDAKEAPPDVARFAPVFALFDRVTTWREPEQQGKRVYDDKAFVESVRKQVTERPDRLSERQLQVLVRMLRAYAAQIPDLEEQLAKAGFAAPAAADGAPAVDPAFVDWCFETIAREPGVSEDKFVKSLKAQHDRGRPLSPRQAAVLAKVTGENAATLPDVEAVRAKLAPYWEGKPRERTSDPSLGEVLKLFADVTEWKEPKKIGNRTYDDREFIESLSSQFARRGSLSDKQAAALKKLVFGYRDKIADFDARTAALGLTPPPARVPRKGGAKRRV